jgi:hypothetical protein
MVLPVEAIVLYKPLEDVLWILVSPKQFLGGCGNNSFDGPLKLDFDLVFLCLAASALVKHADHIDVRKLQVLLRSEALLLSLLGRVHVRGRGWSHLLGEDVLDRQDLVEQLKLLLRDLLVQVVYLQTIEFSDVLEPIYDE